MKVEDWDRADILAAIKKKGLTIRSIALEAGLAPSTLYNAFLSSYPKGEKIIAKSIGIDASKIWAKRYADRAKKRELSNLTKKIGTKNVD